MRVCAACIEDRALQEVVEDNLTECECDYCGRRKDNPIACDLDVVIDYMRGFIEEEYCEPVEEVRDLDAWALFAEIGFDVSNDQLRNDLIDAFQDHPWCRNHYFSLAFGDAHIYGWEDFCNSVKHRRRYTFWSERNEDDGGYGDGVPAPADMLSRLDEIVRKYRETAEVGTRFWRVQVLDADEAPLPHRFTSPPLDNATVPNRMSPAGISMFYGAVDIDTAYEEVVALDNLDSKAVWGIQFESVAPFNLLDLTCLPDPPSYFSERGYESHDLVRFLKFFRHDLAAPIERDGREHIDYVPTQVFTEYVRYEMKAFSGEPFHGIVYPSSKTGRPCYVIFADQEQCLDEQGYGAKPQLLRAVPDSLRKCEGKPVCVTP